MLSVTVTTPAPGGGTSNVAYFQVAAATATVGMATAQVYPATTELGIATADLNGDGKLDLITNSYIGGNYFLSVALGNGDGTFQAPAIYAEPSYFATALVGDFNGDGKPDLLVAVAAIDILLGNGDGTFQPAKLCTQGANYLAAVGDVNGDGKLDVLTLSGSSLIVLLGNGDGTCQAPVVYSMNVNPAGIVTGDLDHDGNFDLVLAGTSGFAVLLGKGDGTFQSPITVPGSYRDVAMADFNGDGILDLALTSVNASPYGEHSKILILIGRGNGTFKASGSYAIDGYPLSLVSGDFNGDGKVDLAITSNLYPANGIQMFLGNGDGTFQPSLSMAGQFDLGPLTVGDFNGDGQLDLAGFQFLQSGTALSINLQTSAVLAPGILLFPPTLEKTSASSTVTLTNSSAAPLNVTSVAISGQNASEFAIASDNCQGASVPPSGNCTVDVTFTPTATAAQSAFLTITDNASITTQTSTLLGNGTPIQLTPDRLSFGSVKVGTISPQKIIKATNVGTATVNNYRIIATGANPNDFLVSSTCPVSLRPKATCSIVVQFIPLKKGRRKGAVLFNQKNKYPSDPKSIPVSGTGS